MHYTSAGAFAPKEPRTLRPLRRRSRNRTATTACGLPRFACWSATAKRNSVRSRPVSREAWTAVHPLAQGVGLLDQQPLARTPQPPQRSTASPPLHRRAPHGAPLMPGRRRAPAARAPHALRTYWATHLLQAGVPVHQFSARLGTSTCAPPRATPPAPTRARRSRRRGSRSPPHAARPAGVRDQLAIERITTQSPRRGQRCLSWPRRHRPDGRHHCRFLQPATAGTMSMRRRAPGALRRRAFYETSSETVLPAHDGAHHRMPSPANHRRFPSAFL
jgi:hypothetical protein